MYKQLSQEEQYIYDTIVSARQVQTFLWGEANGEWGLEEWRRMFRKRNQKIDDINPDNPHAIVELKKRLLQNAALSVALLRILDEGVPEQTSNIQSNLPEYRSKSSNLTDHLFELPKQDGNKIKVIFSFDQMPPVVQDGGEFFSTRLLENKYRVMKETLERITKIEDNLVGGDWDEIEEARLLAQSALGVIK